MNENNPSLVPRRQMLKALSSGFGYLAFSSIAAAAAAKERVVDEKTTNPLAPKSPHFKARAKRVIFLCMRGGPSHLDTFDYKPELIKNHGKTGAFRGSLMKSPWEFKQRGESGLWISDLLPEIGSVADELCLLRGMNTDLPVHPRAITQMHTGNAQFVRPSLGAWTLYGLGTENESMPGFVSVSFLPAIYGGTKLGGGGRRYGRVRRGNGSSVADIKNPNLSERQQRTQLDFIQRLNQEKLRRDKEQPGVEGMIESYELAFRMQSAMPGLMDIDDEDQATLDLYGINNNATSSFGRQCLMARRLSESGVRFVEINHTGWDTHFSMDSRFPQQCEQIDKPIAGLLKDLKQRGLLKDTLVVWAGEFGRTPYGQNGNGRDHNNKGYTTWMAGGGVKGGFSHGATDENGYEAVEGKCHIHDWHATILHLLGLDHTQLTYRYAGRDFRLTDVHGDVVKEILA